MAKKPLMLVAFGGNALIQSGQKGTAEEQFEANSQTGTTL